jgi:hypothetical protein
MRGYALTLTAKNVELVLGVDCCPQKPTAHALTVSCCAFSLDCRPILFPRLRHKWMQLLCCAVARRPSLTALRGSAWMFCQAHPRSHSSEYQHLLLPAGGLADVLAVPMIRLELH